MLLLFKGFQIEVPHGVLVKVDHLGGGVDKYSRFMPVARENDMWIQVTDDGSQQGSAADEQRGMRYANPQPIGIVIPIRIGKVQQHAIYLEEAQAIVIVKEVLTHEFVLEASLV